MARRRLWLYASQAHFRPALLPAETPPVKPASSITLNHTRLLTEAC